MADQNLARVKESAGTGWISKVKNKAREVPPKTSRAISNGTGTPKPERIGCVDLDMRNGIGQQKRASEGQKTARIRSA
jgi:hypothetical protein